MTGIIEGFFWGGGGVEIFHPGMFLGRKIWQVFFGVA